MSFFRNDNFLNLGEFEITMQMFFVIIGAVAGIIFAFKEGRRLGISKTHILDGTLICIPLTLVGARIIGILFTKNFLTNDDGVPFLYMKEKILKLVDIQDGAMSMVAALAVTYLFVHLFCKKLKVNKFRMMDVIVPSLLLGQFLGRIGNIFNLQVIGTTAKSASFLYKWFPNFIIDRTLIDGVVHHPIYLYEAMWAGLGFAVMLLIRRLKTSMRSGDLTGIYLIWFGFGSAVLIEPFRQTTLQLGPVNVNLILGIITLIGGVVFLALNHTNKKQPKYHELVNEIDETSVHCFVFDLDQTVISAENLIQSAYGEILSTTTTVGIYDDPQAVLDAEKLKKYVRFTKEHHEMLTKIYHGVHVTLREIQRQNNEIIFISKLPADAICTKIQYHGLSGYVNRFINSNDIAKLGRQYPTCSVMVFSSDRRLLAQATKYGYKTAYSKFANPNTDGLESVDLVLEKFGEALYIV